MATVVFVHAHPDDEALLTGGTMAKLASAGHDVVVVTATDGAAGLTSSDIAAGGNLVAVRDTELQNSADALGVAKVVRLGYADSGLAGDAIAGGGGRFVEVPPAEAGERVAHVLDEVSADVVVSYDAAGGYGHPDHRHVHEVVNRAVEYRATPLLESTIPREPILRGVKLLYACRRIVPALGQLDMDLWEEAFTPRRDITYRVSVESSLPRKHAALAAHASQAVADDGPRTISVLLRLPRPLFRALLGTEWYAWPGRSEWTDHQRMCVNTLFGQPLGVASRRGS